ncbi:MAG TPA: hypothetical protein VL475_05725, partial [Planctomycetaceae bacterium]|nr:hypothetical protein [Planctomycetaceae bacterium]
MSSALAIACGWSLARSLVVALVAVPICLWLRRWLASLSGLTRRLAWGVLTLPFLFPSLLSGYAYANASLQLASSTWWNELVPGWSNPAQQWLANHNSALDEVLLGLLLLVRSVPVGALLLTFAPRPSYSLAAWHCQRLSFGLPRNVTARARECLVYLCYGPFRAVLAAAGLVFLVSFQEFELPSLLGRPA